jgi:DNA-directed RNA polymerase subunit E'/Rpb7
METEAFFQEKVYLTPKDLRNDIESVDDILLEKLKERLEQRCSPNGYVLPGSLEILTRSTGMVDSGRFSGDWAFLVKAKGRVLHPPEGTMVEVEVLKSNKMGIYAVYENAIRLMVPRDLHLGDEEFDSLKVGDKINVEIQKSRFQLRDPFIVSVGIFRGAGSVTQVKPPAATQLNEISEEGKEAEEGEEGEEGKEGEEEGEEEEGEDGEEGEEAAEEEEEEEAAKE